MKGPLRPFNSIFAGQPPTVKTDHRTVCPSAGFSEAAGGCGGLAPRIHWLIRITAGHPQSTCPALTSTTCFWFALPAAVKARAPKARLHGSRQGKPHPRKPVPVCLQYVCQPKSGCQSTLQKPAKCRCKNLQNRSAITYIFNLQLSAKRGCKKHIDTFSTSGTAIYRKDTTGLILFTTRSLWASSLYTVAWNELYSYFLHLYFATTVIVRFPVHRNNGFLYSRTAVSLTPDCGVTEPGIFSLFVSRISVFIKGFFHWSVSLTRFCYTSIILICSISFFSAGIGIGFVDNITAFLMDYLKGA